MNTNLLNAVKDAVSGLDMAYEALENGRYDEALLHVGQHHARLGKAVEQAEAEQKQTAEWQAKLRAMGEEYRKLKGE